MRIFKASFTTYSLTLAAALFTTVSPAKAQSINPKMEIGASGSAFIYQGDLSNSQLGNFKDTKIGFGVFGRYYFSPVFSARLNFYRGALRGDDTEFDEEWRKKRAYKFHSPLTEFSLLLEADLLGSGKFRSYRSPERHDHRWSIYLFAGVGVAFTDASRDWSGLDRVYFGKDATENIPQDSVNSPDKTTFSIPAGLGIRYDLSKHFSLFAEGGYRFMFTDNLDGYKYAVYSPRYDGYSIYSLGVSYRFGNRNQEKEPIARPGKDRDRDGIMDINDLCPDSIGTVETKGCPDRDHDGIADREDLCPDSAGTVATKGCPDRDHDGIVDKDDLCPDVYGVAAFQGCPDSDGDGIPDKEDKCPDIPGVAKYEGCPVPDTDKDGFNDEVDKCPAIYSTTNEGCPEIKAEVIQAVNIAAKNIFFQTAKDKLLPASYKNLDKIVKILKADETLLADIEGHTDSQGDEDKNMDLSQRRAKVVYDYFVKKGINPARLTNAGFGETRPAATNDTPQGRAQNRRTEIKLRNH